MPHDPHDDEIEGTDRARRRFIDFDCPACSANNPYDDAFGGGDSISCFYCGQEFEVIVTTDGRLRLREA